MLIFIGVIGGLIAFGIIGLFVGPVVLAVARKLLSAWVDERGVEGKSPSRQEEMAKHDQVCGTKVQ